MFTLQGNQPNLAEIKCLKLCVENPVCTVAEVWCCSEHYLWLFDSGFLLEAYTAMYCNCAVIYEVAKTM